MVKLGWGYIDILGEFTINKDRWIEDFMALTTWAKQLSNISDEVWLQPIKEGKWSISEIISHLVAWDRFILEERLLKIGSGEAFITPNVEEINQEAAKYAKSGVSKENLINELVQSRTVIISFLKTLTVDELEEQTLIGKSKISIKKYIIGTKEHDDHHIKQMEEFLNKKMLGQN